MPAPQSFPIRRLGFGLDAQYADRYPGGLEGLCRAYHDRLSHLSIVSLASEAQALAFANSCAAGLPTIHHLPGIAPADPDGPKLDRLRRLDIVTRALDARWICEDIAIWSIGPYALPYFTPPIFEPDIADWIAGGIVKMQEVSSAPFCAEIPSCSIAIGTMPLGAFFKRIVDACGCGLVADVSHVFSYAIARDLDPSAVLRALPLGSVRELHIAGGHVDPLRPNRYLDTHSEPLLYPVLELLSDAVTLCPDLRAVTYEVGVGLAADDLERDMDRLEEVLEATGWVPRVAEESR